MVNVVVGSVYFLTAVNVCFDRHGGGQVVWFFDVSSRDMWTSLRHAVIAMCVFRQQRSQRKA